MCLVVVVSFTGRAGHSEKAHAASNGGWKVVPSLKKSAYSSLSEVAAVAADNVWAVGVYSDNKTIEQPLIEHWNGSVWSIIASPHISPQGFLSSVATISASDIWAVGDIYQPGSRKNQALFEHWDGATWSIIPSPKIGGTGSNRLTSIAADATNDVWAVGTYEMRQNTTIITNTLIEHWNGRSWKVVPDAAPYGQFVSLSGIVALSTSDAWAVGSYEENANHPVSEVIEHWDGRNWSIVPNPSTTNPKYYNRGLYGIAVLSASDIWAVGFASGYHDVTGPLLTEHWNGTAWSIIPDSTIGHGLIGVAAVTTKNVWAINADEQTPFERWNGSAWHSVASPDISISYSQLNAITHVPSTSQAWAVGSTNSMTLTEFHP